MADTASASAWKTPVTAFQMRPSGSMLERASEVVGVLQELVRCDAVALAAADPFDRSRQHRLVFGHNYSDNALTNVLNSFTDDNPAFVLLRTKVRSALRWSDLDRDWRIHFASTPIAEQHLIPAGFREGLTAFLWLPTGGHVGAIHMNWLKAASATEERRTVVEHFRPILAGASDFLCSHRFVADEVFPSAHVAVIGPAGPREIPGREIGPVLSADGPLARLVAQRDGPGVTGWLWVDDRGQPHQVQFVRCADETTLVAEQPVSPPYGLTHRELEVVDMLTRGASNAAIAAALFISARTVGTHIEHIFMKMGCDTRAQVAATAVADSIRLWRSADARP